MAAASQNGGRLAWLPMMAVRPDRTLNTGINTSYYIQNIVWSLMMAKLAQRVKQRNLFWIRKRFILYIGLHILTIDGHCVVK